MEKKEKLLVGFIVTLVIILVTIVTMTWLRIIKVKNNNDSQIKEEEQYIANVDENVNPTNQVNNDAETYVKVYDDGSKLNLSEALNKSRTFGNYELSGIFFTWQDNESVLVADCKNNGPDVEEETKVKVNLLNDAGKTIVTLDGIIYPSKTGEISTFKVSSTTDYTGAYDFQIVE